MNTPSILQKIIVTKREEIAKAKKQLSFYDLEQHIHSTNIRNFSGNLRRIGVQIIAEIKKASPSKGIICQNFNPIRIAQDYEQAGASCLSVLTDRQYFQGHDDYLQQARQASNLPILRKDFMIEPYQIVQSRALGADCILLIMACLEDGQLAELHDLAIKLGMNVLIECHNQQEVERALNLPNHANNIYGINNRNLNNFVTSLQNTLDLRRFFPENSLLVTESGIHSADDIKLMLANQIHCFLIGEQFMQSVNPGQTLAKLLSDSQQCII